MEPLLQFIGSYWWLGFFFAGAIGGGVKAVAAANERRVERRQERYRLKQQARIAEAEAAGRSGDVAVGRRRELTRVLARHDDVERRWLDYEVDVATLLDCPMMTDMREPLTVAFHQARRRAELLRPDKPDDLAGDREAQLDYRDAVEEFVGAFEVAESEARRRRRHGFSAAEQERLTRAQRLLRLATDTGGTAAERQNAYARARTELDGLLILPAKAVADIERRVAGELES